MKITRRAFLKGTAGTAGGLLALQFLYHRFDTFQRAEAATPVKEEWTPTTCWIGKQDCGILARKINGRIVKLEGNPAHPRNRGTLCPKGMGQIFAMYDPHRVHSPLIRTNKKGEHGKWRKAKSWDAALELVAEKIREAQEKAEKEIGKGASEKNNPFIIWQKGRSKAKALYDKAIVPALGATKLHHGAYCSDAGYRAAEYTIGCHGVLHPDFSHCKYLLSWGWNITNAGGNKFCWITWPQKMLDAREKGMKIVHIDPRLRAAGPFADHWVPIKPGTDLALALALCHELVRLGYVDYEYLKQHTNSPFLVGPDGYFLRKNGKELVWDTKTKQAVPHDEKGIEPALEGEYTIEGKKYRPAFQVFKEHLRDYTPAWAANICGIEEDTIKTIARELGENAHIGSTIRIRGKNGYLTLPYRPVAIMAYHVAQQELGFQACRAMMHIMMLLGSFGAVGGQLVDLHWKIHKNYHKLDNIHIKENTNIYLKDSKFFPINSNLTGIVAKVAQNPEKYGVKHLPEVCIIHMANPLVAFSSQKDIKALFEKIPFTVVIDPWLSETADLYADVILPCSTLEKWEGPIKASDGDIDAVTMRVPVTPPVYDTKSEIEIYLDLCEKVGKKTLKKYIQAVNKSLKLKKHPLPTDKKPTPEEILEHWCKEHGIPGGLSYFKKYGVYRFGATPPEKKYGYATTPVFGGVKHRLYGESLLRYQRQMREMKVDKIYWQDYTPLPTWREPTMEKSPPEYDCYLISYKMIEFKQSRSSFIPLTNELVPKQLVYIHPKKAKKIGVKNLDWVWIESHNAVTGETRKRKVQVWLSEGIRPDTVAMPHHYGMWTHPWTKGQGASPNELFYTGEGYVSNTADQSFQVKVKLYKA